jgi:predicted MFS family arabinose efflux permease
VQLEVADSQRGRVMALWSLAFLGTRPFGSLADGAVAQAAGLRPAAIMMAAIGVSAAVVLFWSLPRRMGKGAAPAAPGRVVPGAQGADGSARG